MRFKLKLGQLTKVAFFLKRTPRWLAEHDFFASLFFILIAVIIGALVFYQYSFLAERAEPDVLDSGTALEERALEDILRLWQERQERFDQTEFKEYHNPFFP